MMELFAPAFPVLCAFLTALFGAVLVRFAGILDHPNNRSSHTAPTPRGGGLAVLAGLFAGVIWLAPLAPNEAVLIIAVLVAGAIAGLIGLLDDLFTLHEGFKFIAFIILSIGLALALGPVTELGVALPLAVGLAGSALWLFTVTNAVNFMDGADGLMALSLIPAALALWVMGDGALAALSVLLAAALGGFCVLNLPLFGSRGGLFAGDIGSLGVAMMLGGLALAFAVTGPAGSVWLAPLLLMPLLGDVLLTMASRAKAKCNLLAAHRAHAYQLLLRLRWSHRDVALVWAVMAVMAATLAWLGHASGAEGVKFLMLLIGAGAFTLFHRWVRRQAKDRGLDTLH
jgi:UDP-N-acetylmuramyl pentapeptide phosphotransferase/UDP-N-acetylglucosamine-1-phosphate transferase